MENANNNVYALGARQGLWAGAYFTAIFLLQTVGSGSILAMLIGNLMVLAVPFVLFGLLRRHYRDTECSASFSEVWMHGIMIFLCGSLILALLTFVYFKFIDPGFIYRETAKLIDMYNSLDSGMAAGMADTLSDALHSHSLPSAIQCSISFMWFGCFSGLMLSLIETALVRTFVRK